MPPEHSERDLQRSKIVRLKPKIKKEAGDEISRLLLFLTKMGKYNQMYLPTKYYSIIITILLSIEFIKIGALFTLCT